MKILAPFADQEAPSLLQLAVALGTAAVAAVALYAVSSSSSKRQASKKKNTTNTIIHTLDKSLPILGDLVEFLWNTSNFHTWVLETSLRFHGKPWRIRLPGLQSIVMLTTPELIKEVTTTQFDNFPRGEYQSYLMRDLLGHALVTSDGERWQHQRKAANKFFTAKTLGVWMTTTMKKNMQHVYHVVEETKGPVDMMKLFHDFALQTFAEVAPGMDVHVITNTEPHPLEHAVDYATLIMTRRIRRPVWLWRLERWLNIGPERQMAECMLQVRTWINAMVKQSLDAIAKRDVNDASATQRQVKSVVELFVEQSHEDKDGLRAEDLVDFILSFMLGARNTSALALGYVFLMISKHPQVEQKIRHEMAEMLAKAEATEGHTTHYLTSDHVHKLVYLEATTKETLRLYPSLPVNQREAAQDTVLGGSDGGTMSSTSENS